MGRLTYDIIGIGYNDTRQADAYISGRFLYHLHAAKGEPYVEIGCGSGNYTIMFSRLGHTMTGVDPSDIMLDMGRMIDPDLPWIEAPAEDLPMADSSYQGAMAMLTIHHWTDLEKSFREIHRILRSKGRLVVFSSFPEQMEGYWLNHYFPEMLQRSIEQMPSLEHISFAAASAGLSLVKTEPYFVSEKLLDYFLYSGKDRPAVYFDERVRKGISSFQTRITEIELYKGLAALHTDLEEDKFEGIRARYTNERGDYMFLVFEKS